MAPRRCKDLSRQTARRRQRNTCNTFCKRCSETGLASTFKSWSAHTEFKVSRPVASLGCRTTACRCESTVYFGRFNAGRAHNAIIGKLRFRVKSRLRMPHERTAIGQELVAVYCDVPLPKRATDPGQCFVALREPAHNGHNKKVAAPVSMNLNST